MVNLKINEWIHKQGVQGERAPLSWNFLWLYAPEDVETSWGDTI